MKANRSSRRLAVSVIVAACMWAALAWAQTAETGAVIGSITDPAGARVAGAVVTITNQSTGTALTVTTGAEGVYRAPLLPPGKYTIEVKKDQFRTTNTHDVPVVVTETTTQNLQLVVGSVAENVTVSDTAEVVQTESSALGHVTDETAVRNLPLVVRNYTEIIGLSPGVAQNVTNANELGRGSGGMGSFVTHGARYFDNNFQMNGISANDLQNSSAESGGIPIPNPDAIQEFKVQTGQYDAAFGRNAGANVNVITKSGSNSYHGTLFEFFRNEVLNANDFFFKQAHQQRPVERQNQFGGTFGGPLLKDKLFFFASYQGTRQLNGASRVGRNNCNSTLHLPALTNDRSAGAIGALFAGRRGVLQNLFGGVGPAIAPDGSNINPIALALLQFKLPDGTYLFPNPQTIDPTAAPDVQGFSVLSVPCTYNEDQGLFNVDYIQSDKSHFTGRFFVANDEQDVSFPIGGAGGAADTLKGFPRITPERFWNVSLAHTYLISGNLFNEATVGFNRIFHRSVQGSPFTYSDIGVTASSQFNDLPDILISGCCEATGAFPVQFGLNTFTLQDSISHSHGKHLLRFGGGVNRNQDNSSQFRFNGSMLFLSWPDFLLGLNGAQNGTGFFSNVFGSVDLEGLIDRAWRTWDGFAYIQDDFKVHPRLTLNLGLRYERIGAIGDAMGRNSNFDPARADPNPPASGTLAGFIVPSNFSGGTIPSGVTQLGNDLGIKGKGQNTFGPRIGFAWQELPSSTRFVLRGGYGIYYTRATGQPFFQGVSEPPFAQFNVSVGIPNRNATFANPFPQPILEPSAFPIFTPYSPTTALNASIIDQNYRPSMTQEYSLNQQIALSQNFLLEVGYVGARGTRLVRTIGLNQAGLASASNPIRGITTNTLANIPFRVPFEGWLATGLSDIQSEGANWYNALEACLTHRFSRGLELQVSYTFSRNLDTDAASGIASTANGNSPVGDQVGSHSRYGTSDFNRDHRLIISYVYEFPRPGASHGFKEKFLGGWALTGVTTIQSGQHLSLLGDNANNAFGMTSDLVQLASGCSNAQLTTGGGIESKLKNYFNQACVSHPTTGAFTPTWPIIGDDGIATGFGNSGVGAVLGPGQHNFVIAFVKKTTLRERFNLDFRAELFNAFNTPQFSNPDANASHSTFGVISSTAVNPRTVQLALKLNS